MTEEIVVYNQKGETVKKIIIFNPRRKNIQRQFDEAIRDMNAELEKGNECDIVLESITGKHVKIVEGYFDADPDCPGLKDAKCKWFNKKMLDELKIKY